MVTVVVVTSQQNCLSQKRPTGHGHENQKKRLHVTTILRNAVLSSLSPFWDQSFQKILFFASFFSTLSITTKKGVNMNCKLKGYEKKCKLDWEVTLMKLTAKMNDWMHCGEWIRKSTSSRECLKIRPNLKYLLGPVPECYSSQGRPTLSSCTTRPFPWTKHFRTVDLRLLATARGSCNNIP